MNGEEEKTIKLVRLTSASHPVYGPAMELYEASFPWIERREAPSRQRILHDEQYHFCLVYEEENFVGLALYWETERFLYLEHLCMSPALRNRGYGSRVLSLLRERGKPILLEIEPPEDELSRRRKGFYERCGFHANPYPYTQFPYHRGGEGFRMVVMSCPRKLTEAEFEGFCRYLRERAMANTYE